MRRMCHRILFSFLSVVICGGADWRQFRGNDTNSVAVDENVPVTWSETDNIAWKSELPGRGLSGPIVVRNRVFVTSSSGHDQDRLHVHCFDVTSGDQLWERQFWATGRTACQEKMCVATPTPAGDDTRIFAFYSSNDLACLDLNGNLIWFRGLTYDYPNASNSLGMASSPVVVGDTVIVQVESDTDSFATGIDVNTGLARWKINRPRRSNWTSPTILRGNSAAETLVLLQSSAGVSAVRPRTGKVVWNYDEGAATIPSSTVDGRTVYIPSHGLTALHAFPDSGIPPKKLWRSSRLGPSTPSPLVLNGFVYTLSGPGILRCADTQTGEKAWDLRLRGAYSATPVAAGGRLYFFTEEGVGKVVQTGPRGILIAENDLREPVLCTPAIADGALYVRSDQHLWKIAK